MANVRRMPRIEAYQHAYLVRFLLYLNDVLLDFVIILDASLPLNEFKITRGESVDYCFINGKGVRITFPLGSISAVLRVRLRHVVGGN